MKCSKFIHGFTFPRPIWVLGLIVTFVGVLIAVEIYPLGIIFGLVGLSIITSRTGFEFDENQIQFRSFKQSLGVKRGEWESLNMYPNLSILTERTSFKRYGQSNTGKTFSDTRYNIYLLNSTHRKKILVQSYKNQESAHEAIQKISTENNLKIVKYQPVISESSRKIRERRRSPTPS